MLPAFTLPGSAEEARTVQDGLRASLRIEDDFLSLQFIAGLDVGYEPENGLAKASIVVMDFPSLQLVEDVQALVPVDFPYIPGLLSFREIPAILAALAKLTRQPGLLMVDGQGIAHPRRMGIASHIGVLLDMPSIGVAKSRLTGRFVPPGENRGDSSPLMDGKERVGTVLRSKRNTNPLFVSPGHRVSIGTSLSITIQCLTSCRLPEPTRLADKLSKRLAMPLLL